MSTPSRYKVRPDIDRRKSLQELEDSDWGDPPDDASYLVTTVHNLRRKPVGEFTAEDLRIVIGQSLSLPVLIPLAIERLEADPYPVVDGHGSPGSILWHLVQTDPNFWEANPELIGIIHAILKRALILPPYLEELDEDDYQREILEYSLANMTWLYEAWTEWYTL